MGMSASQVRYLGLTARKNNNEYQAQQINQQRLLLANKLETVSLNYNDKLNNRQLLFVSVDPSSGENTSTRLTYDTITSTDPLSGLNMRVVDKDGNTIIPSADSDFVSKKEDAYAKYQEAINNKSFSGTETDSAGKTTSILYSGKNFVSSYMSAINDDYDKNPILDKDGNQVDIGKLHTSISSLNEAEFYKYWNESGYKFKNENKNILNNTTNYTDDDKNARAEYLATISQIEADEKKGVTYKIDKKCKDPEYLERMLRSGEWSLEQLKTDSGEALWTGVDWGSNTAISDSLYKDDDAAATAEYDTKSDEYQKADKALELQLKQLDSEHSALETEMDSVKKVIDKNVESSFKTFG